MVRCQQCRKKLRLAQQIQCKCGITLCSKHRPVDEHSCNFDFRKEYKEKLEKENKSVVAKKIESI